MSWDYWLGVLTVLTLGLAATLATSAYFRMVVALRRIGLTFEAKTHRNVKGISDHTIRSDIWWERAFGPIFVGGWYRESAQKRRIGRWIGIGRTDGPCWMAIRTRDLRSALTTPPAAEPTAAGEGSGSGR